MVNPDSPNGNYIPKQEMLVLIDWAEKKEIHLVADESFVDFAPEENSTLTVQELLNSHPCLTVLKSISFLGPITFW